MRIYVNSNDTVAGVDTAVTYWGGFTLPEDVENLVVTGDGAVARGNHLDNLIAGGAGRQTFFGGGRHDVFEGGADSDIFVASRADHGNVVVNDFQSGVDGIRLDGFTAFTDFTSVQNSMTQIGSDVVVDLSDGQTLTLRGHQTTDFSAADFWTGIDLSHFQLTFADEFDSFDWSPDGSHGWRTTLDWGNRTLPTNNEAQYYSDASVGVDPFYLHDGVLDITATAGSNPEGLPYNSGVITTQDSFSQLYGYFEMRAQLPAGAGLWPTFSLLPADHSWPPELDVFEVLGSDPTTAVVTVHSASTGAHTMVASAVATADLSEGFHTFGVNWEPDIIQWYIDGVEVAEAPTPDDMHQPMYLLANLAVGGAGSWPGVADPSAFPATMSINYIRVYQPLEQQDAFASNTDTDATGELSGSPLTDSSATAATLHMATDTAADTSASPNADLALTVTAALAMQDGAPDQFTFQDGSQSGTLAVGSTSSASGEAASATDAATLDTTASSSSDHQLTATATTDASAHTGLTSNVATNSPLAADASASNGTQAGTITQTASASPPATGPNGSDTFVFAANFGHETIANFHPDTDVIQIDHAVFADLQALLAATHDDGNGNAVITANPHDTITLENVTVAQLVQHQGDFYFT
jgi:beta-glucanase (GH16 family)